MRIGHGSRGEHMGRLDRLRYWLAVPVDGASVVWFRVCFGLILVWEMARQVQHGWVEDYWIRPLVNFPYPPFTFVQPWPEPWMMYAHVGVVAAAGLAVAVGWHYRVSAAVLWAAFTWLFLIDQTRYLNHFYLCSLLAFGMIFLPAGRVASVDAWRGRVTPSETVPRWSLAWLQFMIFVPYFFGGIAKINPDWLAGEPMRDWLSGHGDYPLIGPLLPTEPATWFFTWGGLLFDLTVVPLVAWRRTRALGLAMTLSFHLLNSRLFKIGIFPWAMLLWTLVWLPPHWPRRVWADVRALVPRGCVPLAVGGVVGFSIGNSLPAQSSAVNAVVAAIGVGLLAWELANPGWDLEAPVVEREGSRPISMPLTLALGAWVLVQVVLPFRHLLIPGVVHWTEEGHRWAWHMKLRDKDTKRFRVRVVPADGESFSVDPDDHLRSHQEDKVAQHPQLLVMYAHWLVQYLEMPDAAVYVDVRVRLNSRAAQHLVDPERDLTEVPIWWWPPADFIEPLREPLPPAPEVD